MRKLIGPGMVTLALVGCLHKREPTPSKDLQRYSASAEYDKLAEEPRYALLIGESKYANAPPLPGASHDIELVATALRAAHFQVTVLKNEPKQTIEREMIDFVSRVQPDGVALVYYSGHGVQRDGRNWLVPVEAELNDPAHLQSDAVDADRLMSMLAGASARLNIVLLDACRNNPWEKSWSSAGKSLSPSGLAEPYATPRGFVLAYATSPGTTAADGGAEAGPYARALAHYLAQPLEMGEVFKNVKHAVEAETQGKQTPWMTQSIGPGNFFFTLPDPDEYRLRYEGIQYGQLSVDMLRSGTLSIDGTPQGTFPAGTHFTPRVPTGAHRVCLDAECREIVLEADAVLDVLFQAPERPSTSPKAAEKPLPKPSEDKGSDRLTQIASLEKLLGAGTLSSEARPETMLRLARAYREQASSTEADRERELAANQARCAAIPGCDVEKVKASVPSQGDWRTKEISLLQQIVADHPQYAHLDEARLRLAEALNAAGQPEAAVEQYVLLVKQLPDSAYVPDAYIALGDYYFDADNAYKALQAFKHATTFESHSQYPYASYKLAWTYYNVGDYGQAIETMKRAINALSVDAASKTPRYADSASLKGTALEDLVRFYADAEDTSNAYNYYSQLGRIDLYAASLARLGRTYLEQGKLEQAVSILRQAIQAAPLAKDAPDLQVLIIQSHIKMNRTEDRVPEVDTLLKEYGPNSAWARANGGDTEASRALGSAQERELRRLAVDLHNEAKKATSSESRAQLYALAYKAYAVYMDSFPETAARYEMSFAYGELLYKIKHYDEAYDQYMAVVRIDPNGKFSKFCAESAIFAADEMMKKEAKPATVTRPWTVSSLSPWEQKQIEAIDQYTALYPSDPKTRNLLYKAAYLEYNHLRLREADRYFRAVIPQDPASKEAVQATNLMLDAYNLESDWQGLRDFCNFALGLPTLGTREDRDQWGAILKRIP